MVKRAQDWAWSRLGYRAAQGVVVPLAKWPVDRPRGWARIVNEVIEPAKLTRLQVSLKRGAPFGEARWSERIAKRTVLTSKLHPVGRPPKRRNSR
jgi:putative transposase